MSQLINEIKQDLHGVKNPQRKQEEPKRMTLMEMVFNDQMGNNPQEIDNPGFDISAGGPEPMPQKEPMQQTGNGQPQPGGDKITPVQSTLPSQAVMDPEIKQMLDEIRVAVIKALGKLANHPESVEYDLMKKILGMIDKPVETQNKMK